MLASLAASPYQATPRPVTTFASESFEAGTFGCQLAALVTASSTASSESRAAGLTFCLRKATGSMPAERARSSTACSVAQVTAIRLPCRNQSADIQLSFSGSDFNNARLLGTL